MRITDMIIVLGVTAIGFSAAPQLIGAGSSLTTREAPSPTALLKTRLMSLDGEWEGHLAYRDYSSDKRVRIPVRRTVHASPGDNYLLLQNIFTDPGYKVYGADMIVPVENGIVIGTSDNDGIVTTRLALESAVEEGDAFTATFSGRTMDAGTEVPARYILSIRPDRMRIELRVKSRGEDFRFRNAFDVERASN